MDLPEFGGPDDRDEITKPMRDREEINRANLTSMTCVKCGTNTKPGMQFRYCPIGCGDKKKKINLDLDILELENAIAGPNDPDGGWQMYNIKRRKP